MKILARTVGVFLAVLAYCSYVVAAAVSIDARQPDRLVAALSARIIADLNADASLKSNRGKALAYAEHMIVPYFDFTRMTQLAVGRAWRQATVEQRLSLTKSFKSLLIRTYIVAFSRYTTQKIRIDSHQVTGQEAVVNSTVLNGGNGDVDVSYRLIRHEAIWQIYDVAVSGISLVVNYRPQFQQAIRSHGIDGLIRLLHQNSEHLAH